MSQGPLESPRRQPSRVTTLRRRRVGIAAVVVLVLISSLVGFLRSSARTSAHPGDTPSTAGKTANPPHTTTAASPTSRATVVPSRGTGTFTTIKVPQTTTASTGREITYILQVENGLSADTAQIARTVGADLLNQRGWQGVDKVRFVQLTAAQLARGDKPTLAITLASPDTVDRLCAPLDTHGEWSCGRDGRAVLNYERWVLGVPYFGRDLTDYHAYMVNHEVGHILGHPHQHCARAGDYAPVMQQQSMGLQGCKAWPWPQRPAAG